VGDYARIARNGGNFKMLRLLKIVRSLLVNLGIIGITLYGLVATGADATIVATIGLLTLGLYNGVEVADYAALAQAFAQTDIKDAADTEEENDAK
jgi:hypothetical protein